MTCAPKKTKNIACFALLAIASVALAGCARPDVDPAVGMIRQMDQAPAEKRPPNWEVTKALMQRRAPTVGEIAPDFTLTTVGGKSTITRSKFQADRPLVMVFGSFT